HSQQQKRVLASGEAVRNVVLQWAHVVNGQSWINCEKGLPNGTFHQLWIALGTSHKVEAEVYVLRSRDVRLHARRLIKSILANIAHDSDNGQPGLGIVASA